MRSAIRLAATAGLALAAPAAAQTIPTGPSPTYQRAVAAGYKAAILCSTIFNAGRSEADADALELRGIYPDYAAIVPTLAATVDRTRSKVSVAFDPALPPRIAEWGPGRGCTSLPIGAKPSPTGFKATLAAADPRPWPLGDANIVTTKSARLVAAAARAFDGASYGKGETTGVVIVKHGRIVAEQYRDGFGPFTSNRTWSVAKSIAGTLVGMARVDPSAPAAIANWRYAADPRRAITTDHLLRMASGLRSDTAGNRTDALYFGGTAIAEQAPSWPLEAAPGTRFRYANNDILLAMLGVRASIGDGRYKRFPTTALFAPLGMRHTVAETDWRGDYMLSSQVWSTPRDFARLGLLWQNDGVWQGKRLLPAGWMTYMTAPNGPQPASGPGYGATMWLYGPKLGLPEGSYAAQGNRGQYIMVVPSEQLIVVRRGEDPGGARFDIAKFTADMIAATR